MIAYKELKTAKAQRSHGSCYNVKFSGSSELQRTVKKSHRLTNNVSLRANSNMIYSLLIFFHLRLNS